MFKKIAIATLVLIIVVSIVFGYLYIKDQRLPNFDAIQAVPIDASIIIKSQNAISKLNNIRAGNEIWSELKNLPAVNRLDEDFAVIIDFVGKIPEASEIFAQKEIVISLHKQNKKDLGVLYYIPLNASRDKKLFLEGITAKLGLGNQPVKRNFESNVIYQIATNQSNRTIYLSFIKGLLIISPSGKMIENALQQAGTSESHKNDAGFLRVSKTAGKNVDANVYINFKHLPEIASTLFNTNLQPLINDFNNIGNWAELDLTIKVDAVLLNGFTFSNSSLNNYLNIFMQQQPVEHKMNSILPSNTSVFYSFGISSVDQYLENYKKYLEKLGKLNSYKLLIDKFKNQYNIDLEKDFLGMLDQEVGLVMTDNSESDQNQNKYLVMQVKGRSIAENTINSMVESIADSENKKLKDYIKETHIDKETKYKIYKFPTKNVFENFFGFLFAETNFNYCTFVDNYLIFSSSEDALLKFIHANILKKTLEFDVKFSQFTEFLSSKSNFYFYCNMLRSTELIASVLNDTLKNGFKTHKETFKKFQALAFQFSRTNDMIYNNLFLKYIPDTRAEAITIWESRLDTVIDFKPTLVTNHYSKENEIFVQDLNHKIYLINKVGRILWQIQLNEKINSEIYQVDYYKNGKLQLLFSTQSQIHLIDRNGNYVERYPIKLRSASTAGISVFDYEKNRDYRLFVPCRNKNIYAYDIQGNLVNGWTFQQSDKVVSTPVQHFSVNTNDYIVFADSYRIYILNRKGEERLRIKNQFVKSDNNQFTLETESQKPHVVTTDTSGTIKKIYFDGKVEELLIRKFTPNHYFDYQDLDGDGSKDFIFVDENKLEVYKQNGSLYFEYSFNETIVDPPIYFYFSYDDRKIGIVSKTSNQIYLFNNDGKLYTGFPLKGSTKFTIGFFERGSTSFNLIVGTNYNLLYNYSVN
ncbi:MAG: DUF3352 domain-containing protein [Bacteroidales bacterium]|jgi:hypothetical protein|nr:DUF3352 domain-containing protein [Bacteroidales bacterium]